MGLLSNFRHKFHNAFFTQVLYGTMASLAIFLTSWDHLDRMRDRLQTKLQNDTDTFDFIIVGSGTAGSTVAYRLSQYYSVLLLEKGGEPHPFQAVPGLAMFMLNHPEIDWMHRSVPQKRAFGNSVKREASLSQGKGLGGSGNLNFLNYLRGSPLDYEHFSNITGDKSWGYSEMKKYFQRIEDYSKETPNTNGKTRGALKIDIPDYVGITEEFILAAQQHGYKHVDLNDNFVEGFDVNYYPIYKGVRQAPYKSYLKPARARKSLTIRKFANVNRILFRDGSTQAYGVEYERHGETKIAKATKEIIVSAGALSTPKILMLSGLGPAEHLQDVGVPLRLDLPVGRNLQDHTSTLLGPFFIREPKSLLLGKDIDTRSFLAWGMEGKGPLTSSFYQASGLILSSFAKSREEDKNWPDIHLQLSSIAVHKTYAQDLAHAYNLQEDILSQYYNHAAGKHSFSISVTNGRPVARGEVLLRSSSHKDRLMINPKYLEDSYGVDVKILRDGIKVALKLAENSTSFQNLGSRFTEKRLPGCEHVPFRSDAYWECYIRQFTISMHSYCGTAAMGKADSKFAVVDPELKVIGAKGLRIIDASVLPAIVVGSTQAATSAVAEKGSENILNYWRQFDVPRKNYDDEISANGTRSEDEDFTDSFSGFSFMGKVTRTVSLPVQKNTRKSSKPKVKSPNAPAASSRTRNPNKVTTSVTTPSTTTTTTAAKQDFEQVAETRFSHNLNQIMEFLRNSRAINEAIDEETYNDLVQNFGERITELMRKNKTEIFFQPVTTTSSTTTDRPLTIPASTRKTSKTTTTRRPSTSFSPLVSKNSFGGFINTNSKSSVGKSSAAQFQSSPLKTSKPQQFSTTTTTRPKPSQTTTSSQKLSQYFLNGSNSNIKTTKITTPFPKKSQQPSSTSEPRFSPLISTTNNSNFFSKPNKSANLVVTGVPKKVSSSTTTTATASLKPFSSSFISASASPSPTVLDSLFANTEDSSTEGDEGDVESTTGYDDEEFTTEKPGEAEVLTIQPTNPPKKIYELILNPDLTINKTKEIDNLTAFLSSHTKIGKDGKKVNRELIEYRTEELRPFPVYPPYKIVNVPGQEFPQNGGRFTSPNIFSPLPHPIILQPSLGIASLTPPPVPQLNIIHNSHLHRPHQITQQLPPPLPPQFQQAQFIEPPKLPQVIDRNLPIQTAKTVLYYTQVFPRDPNEIRSSNNHHNDNILSPSNGRLVSSSPPASSSSLSLSSSLHREDQSQNIVQFFPSVK